MPDFYDEADLEAELERLYRQWGALGYWAKQFHQTFSRGRKKYKGGVAAVRSVLVKDTTDGFAFLKERNRPDLTVETLVMKPECQRLFTDVDRRIASMKLTRVGHGPKSPAL